ncbi:MAG: sigma 54-interacting transcriptional regulator [Spirochaetaceae bacterium]|nr:sigma 54-interacting transcriptional regulator [Spirochaetaceae bacterium]
MSHSTSTQILPDASRPETLPRTLEALRALGYPADRTVKEEMRDNLVRMLRDGAQVSDLFPGILGYEKTVLPGLVNAILSRHDFILLGLRGQAKTRILRSLVRFLDRYVPAIDGTDLNENPFRPITTQGRRIVAEHGGDTPIRWLETEERYQEKLATPDVTIADLIGDVDPIKAATQRLSYADQGVIHYGIVPRTNRGIFAINEVPDLPPRIQVGLLNILEEKDFQIRGFPLRIPLDICMVFSANPEDYTNRGNIISPLKDRIDSQIITHYPADMEHALAITRQEAWESRNGAASIVIPEYFRELIEDVAFEARGSEFVDQKSGVSARMTIALLENVISNVERRCLQHGDGVAYPRLSDLHMALPAITGKLELVYEGEQEGPALVARKIIGQAVRRTFRRYFPKPDVKVRDGKEGKAGEEEAETSADGTSPYAPIVRWFSQGNTVETADDLVYRDYAQRLAQVDGLRELAEAGLKIGAAEEAGLAMELVLEGLHQHSMVSKRDLDSTTSYRDMLKAMFDQMSDEDDPD